MMMMMQSACLTRNATRRTIGISLRRENLLSPQVVTYYYKSDGFSTAAAAATTTAAVPLQEYALESHPKLRDIPSLPLLGSVVPWYSNIPPLDFNKDRENLLKIVKKYGYFYSMGLPGYGVGIYGTVYSVSDPREYMKVVRHEGNYPSGLLESLWPMQFCLQAIEQSNSILPLFGRGTEWKKIRFFLQSDLLSPQSAAGYIPGVVKAAELASKGAPACADDFNEYLNRCAFDMFSTVMFGELMEVADPNTPTDPTNLEFVENAATFLSHDAQLLLSPKEAILNQMLKMKTSKYKEMLQAAKVTNQITKEKYEAFKERYETGTLNELQKDSYLAKAIQRFQNQSAEGGEDAISDETLAGICWALLTASVDTTSGILSWAVVHLALNPDIQDKIYKELQENTTTKEGHIDPNLIGKRSISPYLYAFLRESHRVTPPFTQSILKQVSEEIEIHGQKMPPNQKFMFNNYAIQMDPAYVDDPEEFQPDRWLPEQVEERKGTPKELMDHPFFKDPFSQGARKCPGSRVAMNEVLVFLSQLVLDYKLSLPGYENYNQIPYTLTGTLTPTFSKVGLVPR